MRDDYLHNRVIGGVFGASFFFMVFLFFFLN